MKKKGLCYLTATFGWTSLAWSCLYCFLLPPGSAYVTVSSWTKEPRQMRQPGEIDSVYKAPKLQQKTNRKPTKNHQNTNKTNRKITKQPSSSLFSLLFPTKTSSTPLGEKPDPSSWGPPLCGHCHFHVDLRGALLRGDETAEGARSAQKAKAWLKDLKNCRFGSC